MAKVILKDLKKVYPNTEKKKKVKKGEEPQEKKSNLQITDEGVVAVQQFSLEIADKEFIVLVGPSGCGKSTTLRMIAGLEDITSGELWIGDKLMNDVEPKDRDIAMVFQNYALYPHMTVYENMAFSLKLKKVPKDEIDKKVRQAAEILDITQYLDRKPKALSGGQRQRVAIGRAIVRDPAVFLMDEPLSNLDAKLRVEMRTVIKEIQHTVGITNVYVTHDQEEAMAVSDRIAVINKGDIQQVGTPKDIYQRPANLFVATFIGRSNVLDGELRMENGKPVLHFHAGASITLDNVRAEECKNQPVKISVRPEEFILDASTDATGLKATVDSSVFLGLNTHYFAHTDDGDKIEIIQESQIDSIIPDGTVVRLGIKTEKINVFDAEGKQNLLEGVRNDNAV